MALAGEERPAQERYNVYGSIKQSEISEISIRHRKADSLQMARPKFWTTADSNFSQDRQYAYNVTVRAVRATSVAAEKP
jgi:hypothetical protein